MAAKDFAMSALVFLLVLNAVPSVMEGSGLDDAMGIDMNLGIDDTIDDIETQADTAFSPNTGVVESFVSVTVGAAKTVQLFFQSITAFPALLETLGAPPWITDPMRVIMSVFALLAVIYVATGRRFGR